MVILDVVFPLLAFTVTVSFDTETPLAERDTSPWRRVSWLRFTRERNVEAQATTDSIGTDALEQLY